jgi:hypothetical protein
MAKTTQRLTDLECKNAEPNRREAGLVKTILLPDGNGLYLQLSPSGSAHRQRAPPRTWAYPHVSLAKARHLADEQRKLTRQGPQPSR